MKKAQPNGLLGEIGLEEADMSKYNSLWKFVQENGNAEIKLSFADIHKIAGVAIDHSFLNYKKELSDYGYRVERISLKEKTVTFTKAVK